MQSWKSLNGSFFGKGQTGGDAGWGERVCNISKHGRELLEAVPPPRGKEGTMIEQ